MAYETLATYKIYEWEQEEIVERKTVVNESGEVVEEETVVQEGAHIEAEIIVKQERDTANNRSNFRAEMWVYATAGIAGDGYILDLYDDCYLKLNNICSSTEQPNLRFAQYDFNGVVINPGETVNYLARVFDTNDDILYYTTPIIMSGEHNLDGSFSYLNYYYPSNNSGVVFNTDFNFWGYIKARTRQLLTDGRNKNTDHEVKTEALYPTALSIDRKSLIVLANDFTDETNASLSYSAYPGYNLVVSSGDIPYKYVLQDEVILQVALSFDGVEPDIPYRTISATSNNYTFNFTEAERQILRTKAQGSDRVPIYYLLKTIRKVVGNNINQSMDFITISKRTLSIVGSNPTLNPTVKDINPMTLALTGDENTFVRYESTAEYAINALASKQATIISQSVRCGTKTITDLPYGIIDDTESGTFNFNVVDSRGLQAQSAVFKNLVEYVKPTCYQKLKVDITGETGANIKLTITGQYFDGFFGSAYNMLFVYVRHTQEDGTMGDWVELTGSIAPKFKNNTYELEVTLTGFDYTKEYEFQCRVSDLINTVESSMDKIKMLPVFDWGETDFNFNVPVNINAEDLSMNNETIIRHNKTANNTVLSATGGRVYIRPNGTTDTSGETIFYPNGDIEISGGVGFGGAVSFDYPITIGGNTLADYVIETGTESMGSNGTWYWRKWASGKAEAWGCRNFGNMGVNTAWGSVYRSAIFAQDLPEGVFIRTPDVININFVHSGGGGWISKHENSAPSAITTGSFIVIRPVSGTITPTNIGFHIIGEWK